jgi:hypothetical protein
MVQPKINFQKTEGSTNPYIELLGLSDKNAIVVRASGNSPVENKSGGYIVLYTNGDMYRYDITLLNLQTLITHMPLKGAEKTKSLNLIKQITSLDASKLNIGLLIEYPNGNKTLKIQDGANYAIEIFKGNQYSIYESYSPQDYIEWKAEGYEERQKFLDLFIKFGYNESVKAANIESIKQKDTVYLYFKENEFQDKWKDGSSRDAFVFYATTYNPFVFRLEIGVPEIVAEKDFIKNHPDSVVDINFLIKYAGNAYNLLHQKNLYLITDIPENGKTLIRKLRHQ